MNLRIPKENVERALKIERLVGDYGKADDLETAIKDVLSDLMHLSDFRHINFNLILSQANVNYRYESRCSKCSAFLGAKDSAADLDNFCAPCLKDLGPNFTWITQRVP